MHSRFVIGSRATNIRITNLREGDEKQTNEHERKRWRKKGEKIIQWDETDENRYSDWMHCEFREPNGRTRRETIWIWLWRIKETLKHHFSRGNIYFSRCSKQIRSFATFSFLATIFFRFSTDMWLSTLTEKHPPVVVLIFNVICDKLISAPHPICCWTSCESLPIFVVRLFRSRDVFAIIDVKM